MDWSVLTKEMHQACLAHDNQKQKGLFKQALQKIFEARAKQEKVPSHSFVIR